MLKHIIDPEVEEYDDLLIKPGIVTVEVSASSRPPRKIPEHFKNYGGSEK